MGTSYYLSNSPLAAAAFEALREEERVEAERRQAQDVVDRETMIDALKSELEQIIGEKLPAQAEPRLTTGGKFNVVRLQHDARLTFEKQFAVESLKPEPMRVIVYSATSGKTVTGDVHTKSDIARVLMRAGFDDATPGA